MVKAAGSLSSPDENREHPGSAVAVPVRIDLDGVSVVPRQDAEDGRLAATEKLAAFLEFLLVYTTVGLC